MDLVRGEALGARELAACLIGTSLAALLAWLLARWLYASERLTVSAQGALSCRGMGLSGFAHNQPEILNREDRLALMQQRMTVSAVRADAAPARASGAGWRGGATALPARLPAARVRR